MLVDVYGFKGTYGDNYLYSNQKFDLGYNNPYTIIFDFKINSYTNITQNILTSRYSSDNSKFDFTINIDNYKYLKLTLISGDPTVYTYTHTEELIINERYNISLVKKPRIGLYTVYELYINEIKVYSINIRIQTNLRTNYLCVGTDNYGVPVELGSLKKMDTTICNLKLLSKALTIDELIYENENNNETKIAYWTLNQTLVNEVSDNYMVLFGTEQYDVVYQVDIIYKETKYSIKKHINFSINDSNVYRTSDYFFGGEVVANWSAGAGLTKVSFLAFDEFENKYFVIDSITTTDATCTFNLNLNCAAFAFKIEPTNTITSFSYTISDLLSCSRNEENISGNTRNLYNQVSYGNSNTQSRGITLIIEKENKKQLETILQDKVYLNDVKYEVNNYSFQELDLTRFNVNISLTRLL